MKSAYLVLFFCFIGIASFAQKENTTTIGQTTKSELELPYYSKDSSAHSLVLFEHGNRYYSKDLGNKFVTDYYHRVKIFDKDKTDQTDVTIYAYKDEKVFEINAITYNLENGEISKSILNRSQIFTTQETATQKKISFTLPNIKSGSVVEYSYRVVSPYSTIDPWYFQSHIPKLRSTFSTSILGNWHYNIRLMGSLKLSNQNSVVQDNCIEFEGLSQGSCVVNRYTINDVPAFEEEEYMLSKENYISKLVYDLEYFVDSYGEKKKYTTTWDKAEKTLKNNFLNKQSSKKSYFKKKLPEHIFKASNDLEKAKQVYQFIQNHFTWNERNWHTSDIKIKKAFEEKSGAIHDINLSLYNSLQAANIESYIVVLSTRSNGIPTKIYPIIREFNYIIIKAVVNGKSYFLDASDKMMPFGIVPYKCLNGDARVLDFKNGGYWETIESKTNSTVSVSIRGKIEDEVIKANIATVRNGYLASNFRDRFTSRGKEQYLEDIESGKTDITIDEYEIINLKEINQPVKEKMAADIEFIEEGSTLLFNPVITGRVRENPFKLNNRIYPVDFGYPKKYTYRFSYQVPEEYSIKQFPENATLTLPNNTGIFIYKITQKNGTINLYIQLDIKKRIYTNEFYTPLKEFYSKMIKAESQHIEFVKRI